MRKSPSLPASLSASGLRIILTVVLVALLLEGCDRAPAHPQLREAELPQLIPARAFVFGQRGLGGFSFSPDGSRLMWSGPSGWLARPHLHVRNADGSVRTYRVGGSGTYWSADSRRLLLLDDKSGAENYRLYRLDLDDPRAEPVDLTPYPGVRVWLYRILDTDPEHVLVLHNRRDRSLRDLYRIHLPSGAEKLVAANPGDGVLPVTDVTGRFLGWRKSVASERPRGKPRSPELARRSALSREMEDLVRLTGVSTDKRTAWVLSNRGRDRVGLFRVDTESGQAVLAQQDPRADIERVLMSDVQHVPLTAGSRAHYPHMQVLDPQLAEDLRPVLAQQQGGRFGWDIVSMDQTERRLIVAVYTHGARSYYLLDRDRKSTLLLARSRAPQFESSLSVPQAVQFAARDGLQIPAYLVLPVGVRAKPLPLVVLVHGGPWQRVHWTDLDHSEDMLHAQFLANRGYAVLAINYRGSAGYGRAFMTAAVGEMGRKMQDDLVDGVRWAIEQGIADSTRVGVFGYSYGGYASTMALAQQPEMFSCGAAIAGPSDLARLIETFPAYWELELTYWYRYVGDPAVAMDRERMDQISTLRWAPKIEDPLLVIQGAADVRVRVEQAERLVKTLRGLGKTVQYVRLPEMGHSLGYWAHHLAVLRATEDFFSGCLGGRAARFDMLEWVARFSGRLPLWH